MKSSFDSNPGTYYKHSPVVGSRAKELELIFAYRDIFTAYQNEVYEKQKLNIIPIEFKDKADEISKEIYAKYIKKYSEHGITIENSVSWCDIDLTKTYLSDLENEWNTWRVLACVSRPNHISHIKNQLYRPAYICALHELMHVEEMPVGISKHQYDHYNSIIEVLTVTRTLILMDTVYKNTLNIPIENEVDYQNSFNLFGKSIKQGELANFCRKLEMKYSSLAQALISNESLVFLGHTKNLSMKLIILGCFISILGISAVAISFMSLNVLGMDIWGILAVSLGVISILFGIGLLAKGFYPNNQVIESSLKTSSTKINENLVF